MSNCGTCQYFSNKENLDESFSEMLISGDCVRYPPNIVAFDGNIEQVVPNMLSNQYCGEWVIDSDVFKKRVQNMDRMG